MDSLRDGDACRRDAALMKRLAINTIYVMAIDPTENHDDCFSIFNSVGIYVIVSLRKDAIFGMTYDDLTTSYTTDYLRDLFKVVDAVKHYDNLLGFDLGIMPAYSYFTFPDQEYTYADAQKLYRVRRAIPPIHTTTNTIRRSYETSKNTSHATHLDLSSLVQPCISCDLTRRSKHLIKQPTTCTGSPVPSTEA